MAYCRLQDVNNLVPQAPFTDGSKPPASSVLGWMDDVAVRMDAVLSSIGYVTPVDISASPKAAVNLKRINAMGALGIAQAARSTNMNPNDVTGHQLKNVWMQQYEEEMACLADPQDPFELVDAARTNEQLEKQPENVLRSSVQSVTDFAWTSPAVSRSQVL